MLTDKEQAVLDALRDAWNRFVEMPSEHRDDNDEFRHGIHALQYLIMARTTRRELNRSK